MWSIGHSSLGSVWTGDRPKMSIFLSTNSASWGWGPCSRTCRSGLHAPSESSGLETQNSLWNFCLASLHNFSFLDMFLKEHFNVIFFPNKLKIYVLDDKMIIRYYFFLLEYNYRWANKSLRNHLDYLLFWFLKPSFGSQTRALDPENHKDLWLLIGKYYQYHSTNWRSVPCWWSLNNMDVRWVDTSEILIGKPKQKWLWLKQDKNSVYQERHVKQWLRLLALDSDRIILNSSPATYLL